MVLEHSSNTNTYYILYILNQMPPQGWNTSFLSFSMALYKVYVSVCPPLCPRLHCTYTHLSNICTCHHIFALRLTPPYTPALYRTPPVTPCPSRSSHPFLPCPAQPHPTPPMPSYSFPPLPLALYPFCPDAYLFPALHSSPLFHNNECHRSCWTTDKHDVNLPRGCFLNR